MYAIFSDIPHLSQWGHIIGQVGLKSNNIPQDCFNILLSFNKKYFACCHWLWNTLWNLCILQDVCYIQMKIMMACIQLMSTETELTCLSSEPDMLHKKKNLGCCDILIFSFYHKNVSLFLMLGANMKYVTLHHDTGIPAHNDQPTIILHWKTL